MRSPLGGKCIEGAIRPEPPPHQGEGRTAFYRSAPLHLRHSGQAGIQPPTVETKNWTPAFAGVTESAGVLGQPTPQASFRRTPESSPRGTRGKELDPGFRRGDAETAYRHARSLPRRFRARALLIFSPVGTSEGGWRAEKRKPLWFASIAGRAGTFRRANRGVLSVTGPRFRLRSKPSAFRLELRNRSSASSWQGTIVSPGGVPAPPECVACEPDPQAPHLAPPHETTLQRTR